MHTPSPGSQRQFSLLPWEGRTLANALEANALSGEVCQWGTLQMPTSTQQPTAGSGQAAR